MDITRRDFGLATIAQIVAAQQHARQQAGSQSPHFEVLDPREAKEIEALTERILPAGDTPGAREAGVVYFIDRALRTFDSDKRGAYRAGMDLVRATRLRLFPQSASVDALAVNEQVELVKAIETSDFFELLRTHTVLGFLGPPSYGGNRGQVGWTHIGFEHRMAHEPPFGYYDAEERKGGKQ